MAFLKRNLRQVKKRNNFPQAIAQHRERELLQRPHEKNAYLYGTFYRFPETGNATALFSSAYLINFPK
ncbi:hypothetical protein PUN4_520165 [Paraburkholderia unamae]|nr:hypothetical protein PUN4_520165 [Paraburkholderia unamae]